MTVLSADAIRAELEEAWRDLAVHMGPDATCTCCADARVGLGPDLSALLRTEARYAVDRYRPAEPGIMSDETDETMDALIDELADESLAAVHAIMSATVARRLGGRIVRRGVAFDA